MCPHPLPRLRISPDTLPQRRRGTDRSSACRPAKPHSREPRPRPGFRPELRPPLPLLEGDKDPQRHPLAPGPQRSRSAAVAGEGLLGLHPTAFSRDLPVRRLGHRLSSGFQQSLGYVGFWAGSSPPVSKKGLGWTHRSEARRTLHREGLRSPAVGGQRLPEASRRHGAALPPLESGGKGRGQCGPQGKGQGPCTRVPLGRRRRTLHTDKVWKSGAGFPGPLLAPLLVPWL